LEKDKTIENLENDIWEAINFPTSLVERCHNLRKKKIKDLSNDELRLLIGQNIGLKFIVPVALQILEEEILLETTYYPGDLLLSVISCDISYWKNNKASLNTLLSIYKNNLEKINNSDKEEEINKKVKTLLNQLTNH
jgi:hypothetical protein